MAEGAGFEPAAQGLPVHGISSAAPSAARSPLLRKLDARGPNEDWRRGEDLNPRGTFWAPIRFRVGRLQPGSATPPHQVSQQSRTLTAPGTTTAGAANSRTARKSTPAARSRKAKVCRKVAAQRRAQARQTSPYRRVTQYPGDPISACPGWTASPGTALAPSIVEPVHWEATRDPA